MDLSTYKQFDKLNQLSDLFKSLSFLATECTHKETEQINKTLIIIYEKVEALSNEMNKEEEVKEVKQYNYFHNGTAITKKEFLSNVPEDWEDNLDQYGEFSSGYYRAIPRD